MKVFTTIFLFILLMTAFSPVQENNIEFVCHRMHKASNTCHFNFKIDGAPYRYVDFGCKKSGKKEDVISKVKEGKIALAKDWKMECVQTP